ncbi:MarR family winged helix-turn-helix transcriptional regulator [Algicella marina]|uniref:MarR family transcriptional regulator n=1 Tax=Algicella marina TaxID=2683284 RepID=A0A6P1SYV7_9RHOB|nr:MarR family winged helix-turn-helix transcriptional regulator [Algicella marina]QHQ34396.1 MarR family transcriptional regulator [Algicella marina]
MNGPVGEQIGDAAIELGEVGSSLGFLLRMAQVKVFDQFYDKLAGHGLKPGEFTLLWVIGMNPGVRQGEIARRLQIKPAHMTKLVQRNVDAGLLDRHVPEDDRRAVNLVLTNAGEEFVAEKKPEFLNFIELEKITLTGREFEQLISLLRKFNGMECRA